MKTIKLILLLLITQSLFAQEYNITIKLNDLTEGDVQLGHYYGQHQYIKDTAAINAKGICEFQSDTAWPGGIYFVVFSNNQYFEFMMNGEKAMVFETSAANPAKDMKVKKSKENTIFYDYMSYVQNKQDSIIFLQGRIKALQKSKNDSLQLYKDRLDALNTIMQDKKLKLIEKHPNSMAATIFMASKSPEIPEETPILPNGKKDSTFAYRYYKAHFWDNIDLTDDRILRTPILYSKLDEYLFKVIPQHPDSAIIEVDKLIEKSRGNKEMFKYILWLTTYKYESSAMMGFDKVFVHLVNKYYKTGEAFWVAKSTLNHMIERADKLEPLLLGEIAPNMIIIDTNNRLYSMHSIEADFLIIAFWDTECGHCMKEIPKLNKFYKEFKDYYNLEVFAVSTDTSLTEWKDYIKKRNLTWVNTNGTRTATEDFHKLYDIYSTPVFYLLNEEKRIIAKRLSVDQMKNFIHKYHTEAIKNKD
jgi:peroxiredoxin